MTHHHGHATDPRQRYQEIHGRPSFASVSVSPGDPEPVSEAPKGYLAL